MTNKKLKMAAMSVALTACVAASPLAANADAPEAAPGEPKKEPVAEETKKEENTAEPQVNQEAKNAQETLKDAEVKYNKDNPTTNPDGSQKLDGVIVTNPEGSGETDPDPNPNPNPDSGETDPNPNPDSGETGGETDPKPNPNPNPDSGETGSGETGSETGGETGSETGSETGGETNPNPNPNPDSGETDPNPNPGSGETDTKEKKPEKVEIGTAEKTEKSETNVETKPNPGAEPIVDTNTPPTVEKKPDGSTAITESTLTPGKEITTTTGTGEAKGNLHEKKEEFKKEDINLDKELGEKPDISWDIKQGDKAVEGKDYTVQEVKNDGNKQTLVLRKEDTKTAEMTAEDIAKLVDADKLTMNENGTYTLTRTETILDAEGNPQTRTTYITIRDNKVTTKTTTELTITRKKAEQDGSERVDFEVKYPEITVTNKEKPEDTKTISRELLDTILSQNPKEDGSYEYTDSDGQKYEVKVDGTAEKLNNEEIVARLQKDGHTEYTLGADGEIYYTTPHNETVKLDVTQNELLRRSLTYKVTLTTTKEDGKGTAGEQTATENAKRDAIQNALTKAVDKLGIEDTATASQLKAKISGLTITQEQLDKGGTFEVTLEDGTKYTLTYSAAEVTVTPGTPTTEKPDISNPENVKDVKDHTVTGTAYVTKGTISWTETGKDGEYTVTTGDASVLNVPEEAKKNYDADGNFLGYTLTSTDNEGNPVTTTYTITSGNTSSMTDEQRKELAVQALMKEKGFSTQAELEAAGYTNIRLVGDASTVTWTVTQTTQKKTTNTETLNNKTLTFEGDKNWTIAEDGSTLAYDGKTYTKDEKGNFTRTDENDKKVTYTATEQEEDVLSPDDAKAMLAKKFEVKVDDITLTGNTATFMKNGAPVTVDCTNLKKRTLKIERSEDASWQKVATNEAELQKAYDDLWDEIKKKKGELGKGETLYVGDLQITEKTIKKDVIEYIEEYVTQADMSPEQLKAALKAQAEAAQKQMVTVNADSDKYRENLPNYYAGDKAYYTKDGQRVENKKIHWDWDNGGYYYLQWNGWYFEPVYVDRVEATKIKHLDLASGAELETKDGKRTDCVLVNPTLKWNYDADKLVDNDPSNTDVGLKKKVSFDNEGGKGNGHYEYDRGDNNHPDKSAFYKVTGTVLYDAVKDGTGEVTFFGFEENPYNPWDTRDKDRARNEAFNAYLNETKQTAYYNGLSESKKKAFKEKVEQTYIVEIGPSGSNSDSKSGYQVYTKSANMTAYGYMTRDANTCINRTYNRPDDSWEYVGGYDLMISRLVQTKEGKVVGETESKVKNIFAPISIRTSKNHYLRSMDLTKMTTETLAEVKNELPGGSQETVKYLYDKPESVTPITEETKVEGTGTGHYKSFTNLIRNIFNGEDTGTVEGGFIKYEYHSEKDKDGTPVPFEAEQMVVTTKQDAEVHYTFTSQESRDVWIKGYTQTVVPPVNPGPDSPELPPVEDAKPAPAPAPAPEAPVLPVVQDARPDPAPTPAPAPETPVLPAVQDAKLIQTGTSGWLADLMLGAGMVLSAAGYWMERKRKAMFYKSQH